LQFATDFARNYSCLSYQARNPRPSVGEDVRRYQIAAEVEVREKRLSDAVNVYQDGLILAP